MRQVFTNLRGVRGERGLHGSGGKEHKGMTRWGQGLYKQVMGLRLRRAEF